jgi:hypothetical protein
MRATAVGLALVLVLVLLDRRPGLPRPAARAGLAGAALLALAWSLAVQVAPSWLVPHLPQGLVPGLSVAPVVLGGFAGTALLAVAAAEPTTSTRPAAAAVPTGGWLAMPTVWPLVSGRSSTASIRWATSARATRRPRRRFWPIAVR